MSKAPTSGTLTGPAGRPLGKRKLQSALRQEHVRADAQRLRRRRQELGDHQVPREQLDDQRDVAHRLDVGRAQAPQRGRCREGGRCRSACRAAWPGRCRPARRAACWRHRRRTRAGRCRATSRGSASRRCRNPRAASRKPKPERIWRAARFSAVLCQRSQPAATSAHERQRLVDERTPAARAQEMSGRGARGHGHQDEGGRGEPAKREEQSEALLLVRDRAVRRQPVSAPAANT